MGELRNYLLATAGLLILGGAVQFVRPLQAAPLADVNVIITAANPVPGVAENGDAPESMVITLVKDLDTRGIDLDPVDVSGFRFVWFHGKTDGGEGGGRSFAFRFSTQPGEVGCTITPKKGVNCDGYKPFPPFKWIRVAGPFLHVRVNAGAKTTLQVFLRR